MLAEAGEMAPEETAAVAAEWVQVLRLRAAFLTVAYDNGKKGVGPYHGTPDWQALCGIYDRQAALLGELAAKEWRDMREKITKKWEAKGCSGCDYALDGGYCKQKQCKHWRDKK